MSTKKYISDELLASFIDGNTTLDQNIEIMSFLSDSSSFFEEFHIAALAANSFESNTQSTINESINILGATAVIGGVTSILTPMAKTSMVASNYGDLRDKNDINETSMNSNESNNNKETITMDKKIGFAQAEHEHGKPELNVDFNPEVYQFYKDTCAFQSQAIILRDFGFDVTQEQLVDIAKTQGWYVEGYGTPLDKVGNLLDYYGVPANITENNNIFNLANELSQGHQIIVAVDSGELWSNGVFEKLEDLFLGNQPDHALIVAGIDTSNPNDVRVVLTDPGNGNFQVSYSEKQFMNAWEDSNCFMVSTTQSPQEFVSNGEVMFNTLDSFSGIPYSAISNLSAVSIDLNDPNYDLFFSELLSEPDNWEDLIEKYDDVFEGIDEECDCDDCEV